MYNIKIMGKYNGKTEEIDEVEGSSRILTRKEAKRLIGEYQMAFGAGWSLWLK